GARTQLSEIVTAGMTLIAMLLLAPLIGLMPQATLAAVVIVYSIGLIEPAEFGEILSVRRTEFTWALIAFAGVVLVGTLKGILVAIIVSMVALAYQASDPPVYVLGRKPFNSGPLLRSINKASRIWGHGFTPKVIWAIVKVNAKNSGLPAVAPHDLRRT